MKKLTRKQYSDLYGITVGDSVRLGDTNLWAKVEKDLSKYGEEAVFGGGKTLRDGMGMSSTELHSNPLVMDLVITNALILDYYGIYKADIGIKNGKIAKIGHAGNPAITNDIDMIVGISTEIFAGEGKIFTPGAIDTHVHFIEPKIADVALENGTTTLITGGAGLNDGSKAVTTTPGPFWLEKMLQAAEDYPINVGFLGKGNGANEEVMLEQIAAGACGLKIHEDWGATWSAIDYSLRVADKTDVQISIHTDTLNEGGFVDHTIDAVAGRAIHAYHSEGAGGGHAPDILVVSGLNNFIPASTSPTLPYTVNTIDEHLDMLMVCHHLNPKVPEDVAFADSRIRKETIAAEDILHDIGAVSVTSSDALAMGRIGEVVTRTWQVADKMKKEFGSLKNDKEFDDNNRIKRYVAKYSINPAIAHGVDSYIGSIEEGKFADIIVWDPKFFGAKPYAVFKSGILAKALSGDANGSIPTCEPLILRDQYAGTKALAAFASLSFVSKLSIENKIQEKYNLKRNILPVKGCRTVTKASMKNNSLLPTLNVDPQTFSVTVDEKSLQNWLSTDSVWSKQFKKDKSGSWNITADPEKEIALAQLYFLY